MRTVTIYHLIHICFQSLDLKPHPQCSGGTPQHNDIDQSAERKKISGQNSYLQVETQKRGNLSAEFYALYL